jgi:hypothetical protein
MRESQSSRVEHPQSESMSVTSRANSVSYTSSWALSAPLSTPQREEGGEGDKEGMARANNSNPLAVAPQLMFSPDSLLSFLALLLLLLSDLPARRTTRQKRRR